MNNNFEVLPLFSSPVCVTKVEEDLEYYYSRFKENYDFVDINAPNSNNVLFTKRYHVLEDYPELKTILMKYFYQFRDQVLKLNDSDFTITTSWVTKSSQGSFTHYHNHANSYYSGVLYFDRHVPEASITFSNFNTQQSGFMVQFPTEYNIFNSEVWKINTEKNRLIFFPSYLYHQISPHEDSNPRYSLAFNILPHGIYGHDDAHVKVRYEDFTEVC